MRNFTILPLAAALAIFLGGTALAADRVNSAATLIDPNTHAYVGTYTQSCQLTSPVAQRAYVGMYLGNAINLQGSQFLSITGNSATIFSTARQPNGAETLAYEVGGQSNSCMPAGAKITLILTTAGPNALPLVVIGTGKVTNL